MKNQRWLKMKTKKKTKKFSWKEHRQWIDSFCGKTILPTKVKKKKGFINEQSKSNDQREVRKTSI